MTRGGAVPALLLAATVLLLGLASVCAATAHRADTHKHALFVSIPLPGHNNPLLAQGLELRRRGWNVTIASPARMKNHIERAIGAAMTKESRGSDGQTLPPLTYMNLGECTAIASLADFLGRAADHEDYLESAREMFEWSLSLHHCMYSSLAVQVPSLPVRPSVVVSDFASYAGFDLADALNLTLVINNPDLLNMLSPDDVAPYDFIPGTMTATSLSEHNSRWYGLVERTLYPPLRILVRYLSALTAERDLHAQQALSGLSPTHLFSRMSGRLILVNGAFGGLEYPRPTPPNIVMVGHMDLAGAWEPSVARAREEYVRELDEADAAWLGAAGDIPSIWVSMGTIAPLNERQVRELYAAFARGVRGGHFRVLWKLEERLEALLPPASERPDESAGLKLTSWVSSQLGVLAHPATQLFVSHCGINSVHESVYLGKGVLCMPILADQADMAVRVADAGVGLHVSKSRVTADELFDMLLTMLRPEQMAERAQHLHRARASMLLSGGVVRATDFIEYAAEHGVEGLVPVDVKHPWWVRHYMDMYAVWALIALMGWALAHCICCRVRPGKECVKSRKDIKATGRGQARGTGANAKEE